MAAESLYKTAAGQQAVMAIYDSVLSHWPVPYETQLVPTPYGDTFVITCGKRESPPLVLLHGAGTNSGVWIGEVKDYSLHYCVYLVDLIGEAGKSSPNRPAWEGTAFDEWLGAVLNNLQLDRPILVGNSQGAWTALRFATRFPERVSQLILMTPGGVVPDKVSFLVRAVLLSMLGRWGAKRLLRLVFGRLPLDKETEDAFLLIFQQFKARIGVLPIFTDEELRRLTMPTMLIIGAEDTLRDAEKISKRLGALLPQLEVVILPQFGHVLFDTPRLTLPFLLKGD